MHARELVELAAIVAAHGPILVRGTTRLSASGLEEYWTASKCRLDRWGRCLKNVSAESGQAGQNRGEQWPLVRGVLEEILTGEVLTRVWTAVVCACDRQQAGQHAEPVARSVLIGHLEARHRVLTLLVRGRGIDAEQAVKLNHLRRRCERWTDLLVGYLSGLSDTSEFAIDAARAKDFADDLRYQGDLPGGRQAWPLILASLRSAFRQGLSSTSPNADLNARISAAILSCFPAELFDSTGLLRSLWLLRLTSVVQDAAGMIESLLTWERSPQRTPEPPGISRPARRLWRFGE